ncbi:MAG: benzoyl-CoA reductase subunit, partial [Bacteroidota bacterium]|nr:benzoyl-CoA reductase subunit [Bacteroidota bacterium]
FMLNGINELALNENLNIFDGFIFPSLCEIIQNTTIAKISEKSKFIKYLDFPQYYHTVIGDIMNQNAVNDILKEMYRINKVKVNSDRLRASIQLYKRNLKLTELIYNLQKTYPERITFEDLYYLVYSGFVIPIEEHNAILENVLHLIQDDKSEEPDDFFNVFGEEIFF